MDTDTKEQIEVFGTRLRRIEGKLGEINQGLQEVSDLILLQTALQADLHAPGIRDYVATRVTGILREKKRAEAAFYDERKDEETVTIALDDLQQILNAGYGSHEITRSRSSGSVSIVRRGTAQSC